MSAEISAGMAVLKTGGRWTDEIDRVLSICLTEVSPGRLRSLVRQLTPGVAVQACLSCPSDRLYPRQGLRRGSQPPFGRSRFRVISTRQHLTS